jgi:hypothetical protein
MAKSAGFMVIGYYFDSNINEAIIRNEGREGKERIPIAAIKKTYAQLEIPSLEEGFDLLYFVRINENRFVVEELNAEIVTNLNL